VKDVLVLVIGRRKRRNRICSKTLYWIVLCMEVLLT